MADAKPDPKNKGEKPRRIPPHLRARSRGMVNSMMDSVTEQLKERHPDKEYRWVYAPPQGSNMSQVMARSAQGYRLVDIDKEGIDNPFVKDGSTIRTADVVLMEIPKDWREEEEAFLKDLADEEAKRPERVYREYIEKNTVRGVGARPTGSIERYTREYEATIPQSKEE